MTRKQMEDIFGEEIPVEGLALDSGIWEFHKVGTDPYNSNYPALSIGVSYEMCEDDDLNNPPHPGYIFNLFVGDQYIDIPGNYNSIYDAVPIVTKQWNDYTMDLMERDDTFEVDDDYCYGH